MSALDLRNPLVVELRELGRGAGAMLGVDREVPAPADLGAGTARVQAGSTLSLRLRLEAVGEGVLVSGSATATVNAECSRCLDPVSWTQTVGLTELYLHEPDPTDQGMPMIQGDALDLEPTLRDAVVLALPLAPLCRADCPGLCPECGIRLATEPDHRHDLIDPRWAGLAPLRNESRSAND